MHNPKSELFSKQFEMMLDWVNGIIDSLSDEDFEIEVSPGKNTGVWILGHLIASEDDLSEYLGKGEMLFPEHAEMFGQKSKKAASNYPAVAKLRNDWKTVCDKSRKIYEQLKDDDLNQPHALLKDYDSDYFKTQERVIMAWQLHQLYHTGQLGVIASIAGKNKY